MVVFLKKKYLDAILEELPPIIMNHTVQALYCTVVKKTEFELLGISIVL